MSTSPPVDIKSPPVGHVYLQGTILQESLKAVKFDCRSVNGVPIEPTVTTWIPRSQTKSIYTDPDAIGNDILTVTTWIYNQKDELHG